MKESFLEKLYATEAELPKLLADEATWNTLFVNYSQPFVERVYRDYNGLCICLHRIASCDAGAALFHPHPWPSAMRIVSGSYEMGIGYGTTTDEPPVAATLVLPATSVYEMTDPNGWHWVRPLTHHSLSLMITGITWNRLSPKSTEPLGPLSSEAKDEIMQAFRNAYA